MADINNTSLAQLTSFLNKLFQFESQDLDFGVYKILHYKRKEIKQFIDKLLVDDVQNQLKSLSDDDLQNTRKELSELEKSTPIKKWLEAIERKDSTRLEIYEEDYKEEIAKYKNLQKLVDQSKVSEETENIIYNHLTTFFSRYYDKGDFVSKRRFGKNEKYVVPYNGEETHFYWANHDQYYIKSSETFQKFSFKINQQPNDFIVHFKLTEAQVEQGNVKSDENKYFILSEKEPELEGNELSIFFEYRAMTDDEKKKITGNNKQDKLDEEAAKFLQGKLKDKTITAKLWEIVNDESFLLKKLHHYTRKNKYDFFIHKNLKGFLQRELDFYIKSELLNVDDLYVSESDKHFENIRHNLKTIKVFKHIADTIIEFLAQIEEFQKKLWEKKKFVIGTEWVITIDHLIKYIGEEAAKSILEEVIKNEKQIVEWKKLFGEEYLFEQDIKVGDLKTKDGNWIKYPIDTQYFSKDFKNQILSMVSIDRNIEEALSGIVIDSDNFHGLNLFREKYYEQVNTIYIDPPYNSGGDDFIYKDSFRNSSWLSMLANRIPLAKDLMANDGLFFTSIDDKDTKNKVTHLLSNLLEVEFGKENYIENIIWIKNTTHNDAKTFSHNHEYIQSYTKNKNLAIQEHEMFRRAKPGYTEVKELVHKLNKEYPPLEKISQELRNLYRKQEKQYKQEIKVLGLDWNDEIKKNNPWKGIKQYKFADYRTDEGKFVEYNKAKELKAKIWVYREDNPSWPNANTLTKEHKNPDSEHYRFYKPLHPITNNPCPPPKRGWIWRQKPDSNSRGTSFEELSNNQLIHFGIDEKKIPQTKRFLDNVSSDVAKSVISDFTDGEKELANIFGERGTFPNPKPTTILKSLISLSSKTSGYILDFFGGSGTIVQSIFLLNDAEDRQMRFLIQDFAKNIYQTIIPRIKKIAYSFDWKDGNPKDKWMNGLGVFFKYQRLEQYEETLENIAFSANEQTVQKALDLKDYIPKYFLEFETRNSKSLVNTEVMQNPWDYKLKVWNGFTYDNEQAVDLVETFNYLIGLHMQKCITKDIEGVKYQFVIGNNNAGRKIAVVWRNITEWVLSDFEKDSATLKEELKAFTYDLLYINGQAHIEGYQPIEEVFKNKMIP